MGAIKYSIEGSEYVGAYIACSDNYSFVGAHVSDKAKQLVADALGTLNIGMQVGGTDFIGLFCRVNSKGIAVSNLIYDHELAALRQSVDIKVSVIDSDINAVGNDVLANDKIAIINPDYSNAAAKQIQDALDVEVIRENIAMFKTAGATNLLTNKGMVINNRSSDSEKQHIDRLSGFDSARSTANTGSVAVGLSAVANSKGIVAGSATTGYELARIMQALELE